MKAGSDTVPAVPAVPPQKEQKSGREAGKQCRETEARNETGGEDPPNTIQIGKGREAPTSR